MLMKKDNVKISAREKVAGNYYFSANSMLKKIKDIILSKYGKRICRISSLFSAVFLFFNGIPFKTFIQNDEKVVETKQEISINLVKAQECKSETKIPDDFYKTLVARRNFYKIQAYKEKQELAWVSFDELKTISIPVLIARFMDSSTSMSLELRNIDIAGIEMNQEDGSWRIDLPDSHS